MIPVLRPFRHELRCEFLMARFRSPEFTIEKHAPAPAQHRSFELTRFEQEPMGRRSIDSFNMNSGHEDAAWS